MKRRRRGRVLSLVFGVCTIGGFTVIQPVTAGASGAAIAVTADSVSPSTFAMQGTQLSYSYTIQNTGDVTLDDVGATSSTGAVVTCSIGSSPLAPGDSTSCSASYTTSLADEGAGDVDETVTASGQPVDGEPTVTGNGTSTATGPTVVNVTNPDPTGALNNALTALFGNADSATIASVTATPNDNPIPQSGSATGTAYGGLENVSSYVPNGCDDTVPSGGYDPYALNQSAGADTSDKTVAIEDLIDTVQQAQHEGDSGFTGPVEIDFPGGCYQVNGVLFLRGVQDLIINGDPSGAADANAEFRQAWVDDDNGETYNRPRLKTYALCNSTKSDQDSSTLGYPLDYGTGGVYDVMWWVEGGCNDVIQNIDFEGNWGYGRRTYFGDYAKSVCGPSPSTPCYWDNNSNNAPFACNPTGSEWIPCNARSGSSMVGNEQDSAIQVNGSGYDDGTNGQSGNPYPGVLIQNNILDGSSGDFVTVTSLHEATTGTSDPASDITVYNNSGDSSVRDGFSCAWCTNVNVSSNTFADVNTDGVDVEADNSGGSEKNIAISDNLFKSINEYLFAAETEANFDDFSFTNNEAKGGGGAFEIVAMGRSDSNFTIDNNTWNEPGYVRFGLSGGGTLNDAVVDDNSSQNDTDTGQFAGAEGSNVQVQDNDLTPIDGKNGDNIVPFNVGDASATNDSSCGNVNTADGTNLDANDTANSGYVWPDSGTSVPDSDPSCDLTGDTPLTIVLPSAASLPFSSFTTYELLTASYGA